MTTPPFAQHVAALKATLLREINAAIQKFNKETGVTPSDIFVNMVEITTLNDAIRQRSVASVIVEFDL